MGMAYGMLTCEMELFTDFLAADDVVILLLLVAERLFATMPFRVSFAFA